MGKTRINIYVHDTAIRTQVKTQAAKHDISISDYCLQAIIAKLAEDKEVLEKTSNATSYDAVNKARRFLKKTFKGKVFHVSSTCLIKQTRKQRLKQK